MAMKSVHCQKFNFSQPAATQRIADPLLCRNTTASENIRSVYSLAFVMACSHSKLARAVVAKPENEIHIIETSELGVLMDVDSVADYPNLIR